MEAFLRFIGRPKTTVEYTAVATSEAVQHADTGDDILAIQKAVIELTQHEQDKVAKAQVYYRSFIKHMKQRMKDMAMQDYQYFRKLQDEASQQHKIIILLDTMFEALKTQETSAVAIKALAQGNKLLDRLLKDTEALDPEKTKEEMEDLLEKAREQTNETSRPLSVMSTGMLPPDVAAMEKEFALYEQQEEGGEFVDESFAPAVAAVRQREEEEKEEAARSKKRTSSPSVISAESLVEIPL
jgi:hypothetical protein